MTNHFRVFGIVLGLCFSLIITSNAFAGPPSQEEANKENKACKAALKDCKNVAKAGIPFLAAQWMACKAVRSCKKECRTVKKECKQDARSTKKQCIDQCKSRFGSGKKFRECKKHCKDDKKESKQDCKDEKSECKNICRASFISPECREARAASTGVTILGCSLILDCMKKEDKRAGE